MYFLQSIKVTVVILISMELQPVVLKDLPSGHSPGNHPDGHGRSGNHGNGPGNRGYGKPKQATHRGKGKGVFNAILQANKHLTIPGDEKLFQGDVIITEEIQKAIKTSGPDYIVLPKKIVTRALSSVEHHKWPLVNGAAEIPYIIEDSSEEERRLIEEAIGHWTSNVPCLRFVPRTSQADYISFFKGQGCYSYVGRRGGNQRISIGENCKTVGIVAHEIGHALGFWHEQARPDRDNYVKILWDNIQYGKRDDFKKILNGGTDDLGVKYDYNSLMHYGPTAYAKKEGLNTIVKRDGSTDFGSATELSRKDIEQARLLYCPGTNACSSLYEDKYERCAFLTSFGYCELHKSYMDDNCKRTCTCRACEDTISSENCSAYKRFGSCEDSTAVQFKCRKTCKLCY